MYDNRYEPEMVDLLMSDILPYLRDYVSKLEKDDTDSKASEKMVNVQDLIKEIEENYGG